MLTQLATHVMVINSDSTLARKKPAREFDLLTYYPLPKAKVDEYKRNGHIANQNNNNDDIADFVTYKVKNHELLNEKQEKLQLTEDSGDYSLQDFSLWTYDKVLCSQRGIYIKLDKPFERVKGHITLVFEMPGNSTGETRITREVRVPIDLSITDKDPRPGV
ncbi:MAG: hypothetical protein EOP81_01330 [Variovorax sp.]|nr:MAG: hypothetical protein EOP81_01330 [Variovorax sp.]